MKRILFFSCWLFVAATATAQQPVKLAVIGSSTSACFGFPGGITDGNCWVNRVVNYYNGIGYNVSLFNLAVSGYNTYQGMPTGYPPITIGNTYSPDPLKNITMALSFSPDVVIVNYPSNLFDVANVHDVLGWFRVIKQTATNAGVTCYVTTAQPRGYDVAGRAKLREIKDSILLEYGYYALNFWDTLAMPDGTVNPIYGQGDGTHFNALGHDTLAQRVIAKGIFLPPCTNRSVASGNWKNPLTWEKKQVPGSCDSVVLKTGHAISIDTIANFNSLRLLAGSSLQVNSINANLTIGAAGTGNAAVIVDGSLAISNGAVFIRGRLEQKTGSSFAFSGGTLTIDGNTGDVNTSVPNGSSLFNIDPAVAAFSFTGGTLKFIDPPLGANSVAINCPFNFGAASLLQFGDGVSITPSNNENGFGGNGLPAQIGKLVLDAVIKTNNRIFKNTSPLTVTGSLEVKSGDLQQGAALIIAN